MHKAIVLCYHRINDPTFADPWELMVSPENFDDQMRILSNHYNILSIKELLFLKSRGIIPSQTVCVSFDDGYADNYTTALPILKHYDLPATFFLVSGMIGKVEYWWDQLARLILWDKYVSNLSQAEKELNSNWKWYETAPTAQSERYLRIWMELKGKDLAEIEKELTKQFPEKEWGREKFDPDIMNPQMINELLSYQNATIGVHTMSHPALSQHSTALQEYEIRECYKNLAANYGTKKLLPVIAYPYGDFNDFTLEIARSIELKAGFTTEGRSIGLDSNNFRLGRFVVKNQNGKDFRQQIDNWFSL